ncbi:hypothetical protein C0991_000064 [Blastosporella zonata]|nr:hypothetical protein C0991_000064 [Blastosporella zonata]
MDPTQAAKQFAALSAASQARIANTRPAPLQSGTNSAPLLGGTNPPGYLSSNYDPSPQQANFQMPTTHPSSVSPSLVDPMSHSASRPAPQTNSATLGQRRQGFLQSLGNVMASLGTPLPPNLTGVPNPNYDHSSSQWKNLEISSELGTIRLAGRDVGLFPLWGSVFQSGGGQTVTANNGWGAILHQFGLSDNSGTVAVIKALYTKILYPFEQYYRSNLQDQQNRARQAGRQGSAELMGHNRLSSGSHPGQTQRGPPAQPTIVPPSPANGNLPYPLSSAQRPESTPPSEVTPGSSHTLPADVPNDSQTAGFLPDGNVLDQDIQGIKRKIEHDDRDGKRARQKIGTS